MLIRFFVVLMNSMCRLRCRRSNSIEIYVNAKMGKKKKNVLFFAIIIIGVIWSTKRFSQILFLWRLNFTNFKKKFRRTFRKKLNNNWHSNTRSQRRPSPIDNCKYRITLFGVGTDIVAHANSYGTTGIILNDDDYYDSIITKLPILSVCCGQNVFKCVLLLHVTQHRWWSDYYFLIFD